MSFWKTLFGGGSKPAPLPTKTEPVLAPPEPPRTAVEFVRTLTMQPEDELAERLHASPAAVQAYVERVIAEADAFWQAQTPGRGRLLSLFLGLKPGAGVRAWVESQPAGLTPAQEQKLCERLQNVPPPLVVHGPVVLAVHASLWQATGPEQAWPGMPRSWAQASVGRSLRLPDEVLSVVWPD